MRVLWFSGNVSLFEQNGDYKGGWIGSLEQQIKKIPNIELGIAFYYQKKTFKVQRENVCYYPMTRQSGLIHRIKRFFFFNKQESADLIFFLKVIEDFKPDIIHIFGSELSFGLVNQHTNIPVVIHLQGVLNSVINSWYPPGYGIGFFNNLTLDLKKSVLATWIYANNKYMASRETRILKGCSYFMGRTDWDKRLSKIYAPQSKYFYCSEIIRSEFLTSDFWQPKNLKKMVLISTISMPMYKGADMILKTANVLKTHTCVNFEWYVYGMSEMHIAEKKLKINPVDVNVKLMGNVSAMLLKKALLESDMYFHPSYIDNSPNSVCEAQILGVPVIACNVGGVSSIVTHNETGLLIPANDPYLAVSYINELFQEKNKAQEIGQRARKVALQRHDPRKILSDLLSAYEQVINSIISSNGR